MIKAIMFDLWETLGTKNIGISKLFFEHFSIPAENRVLEKYEKAVQLTAWNSEEEMSQSLLRDFDLAVSKENITWTRNLFREGVAKATLFPGTLELLESVRGKYKLALISNTSIFESRAIEKLGIGNRFDVISFSWEIGALKPSVKIFAHTLQKLGVSPQEAVFIDDGQKNIDAAVSLGIQGLLFDNTQSLRRKLIQLKVEI